MRWNEGCDYVTLVGPEADGEPLLSFLASRYRHSTLAEWAERIGDGRVLVDGARTTPSSLLRRGQKLVWRRPGWQEPPAPATFLVLEEDDDVLAVAKPAGLPTLPGAHFLESTLLHLVRIRAPGAAPVHRLGRWTSGVVLFGRTTQARAALSRQWAEGKVEKRYRALAAGAPGLDAFTIEQPIGPVPHPLLGSVHAATPSGKPARSDVTVLERREGCFVCEVRIATGRPHQIRIHLAAAGHPLLGDPLYGAGGLPLPESRAVPGDGGYHLHAMELAFRHPRLGHPMRVRAFPPEQLRPGS